MSRRPDQIFERVTESYRRNSNTLRYLLGNIGDFSADTDSVPYAELPEIDRWMLQELYGTGDGCPACIQRVWSSTRSITA